MEKPKNPLIARMEGEVLAVSDDRRQWFESCLSALAQHPDIDKIMAEETASSSSEDDGFWPPADDWRAHYRPYVVKQGILHIPVMGVLLNRMSFQLGTWATGYTYIERALRRGMQDPEVRGILFICDSPGGEVSGCFEVVDKIFEARGTKPMKAVAADRAYSAGYAIASAADVLSMVRTGGVGSIGIVVMHVDYSDMLTMAGIKVTFIKAGERKTDGNRYERLSSRAKQRIKARVDEAMDVFVAAVSRSRGLADEAIRGLEADCFGAQEAIQVGLADKVETFEESIIAFTENLNSGSGDLNMTTKPTEGQAITQAQLDAAVTDAAKTAQAEGLTTGAKNERSRIVAIMGCEEAKNRQEAAFALAVESDMSAEAAAKVLAKLPEAKPAAATPEQTPAPKKPGATGALFEAAMRGANPDVGAGDETETEGDKDAKAAAGIMAAYGQAGGTVRKAAAA